MAVEKRPASNSFGSSQIVKRQRSDANLASNAVAVVDGSAQDGALIQAVSYPYISPLAYGNVLKH